jgi:RHS repeat-associated protein
MMNQLLHSNGVTDTQAIDSSGMARPRSLTTSGSAASWASGIYSYDAAGNIKAIGSAAFVYAPLSRITSGTLASASNAKQTYTYDDYGNFTKIITNGSPRNLSVNTKTNRLTAATYDSAGNMLSIGSGAGNGSTLQQYQYDAFNMMTTGQNTTQARGYVYTADDERMVEFDFAESPWVETWTIRGLDKKVLRQWTNEGGEWIWSKDHIYRGSLLLASEEPEQGQHLHLDHLGTPRLITSTAGGGEVGRHTYFPFGEEVTDASQDGERMKFTGHERDLAGVGGGDDLDYMHARYYSPQRGRFLTVDPGDSKKSRYPQSWNKYTYGKNSPVNRLDPNGKEDVLIFKTAGNPERDLPDPWGLAARRAAGNARIQFGKKYENLNIKTFDVNRVRQVNAALSAGQDIVSVIFIGHSSPDLIAVGSASVPDTNISTRGGANDVDPSTLDFSNMSPGATITILGCNAGAGSSCIAQDMANASGVPVNASDSYINFDDNTGEAFIRWWRSGNFDVFLPEEEEIIPPN